MVAMITKIINFLIDELLWMVSWGWYQVGFGVLFTWLSYMFLAQMRMGSSLVLAISAYAFAVGIYFAVVAGLFVHYFTTSFIAGVWPDVYNPLCASLMLSVIISLLQLLFYGIINCWYKRSITYFFFLSLFSNIAAAIVGSLFIKVIF